MANVIFWDVDTQHDFMVPDGKLYVTDAEHIAPQLKHLTEFAREADIVIVASVCDHSMDDEELSETPDHVNTFPPHCLRNAPGAKKIPATAMKSPVVIENDPLDPEKLRESVEDHDGEILIKKQCFDVFANPNTLAVIQTLAPDHAVLYGVALDDGDRMAIEGLLELGGITVHLVTDAVKAFRPERIEKLLEDWRSRGVKMITSEEIVDKGYLDSLP